MKARNTVLYLGIGVIIVSLIYMILNLNSADNFIAEWAISMITGVSFTFWGTISLVIKRQK